MIANQGADNVRNRVGLIDLWTAADSARRVTFRGSSRRVAADFNRIRHVSRARMAIADIPN